MNTLLQENKRLSQISDLTEFFYSGINKTQNLGVEFEKISISNKSFKATEFLFNDGMLDFLSKYKESEKFVPCYENDVILGLISNHGYISLEPGAQLEYSLKPLINVSDIEKQLDFYNKKTAQIASEMGMIFLALGLQPVSTFRDIKIIPKARYSFMTKYLRDCAQLPFVMMRESAGIQVSIDYSSEEDAILKLSTALKLSPFMSAFFANSPIRAGKLNGYKSFRANAWLNTDNKRCGLISKELFQKESVFNFEDYVKILLDVPMIFQKDNYVGPLTFGEFFNGGQATFADWETHLSLFFPDVRLKKYIEIRNHDCQKKEYALAIPAIYKGIFYSRNGIEKVNELLAEFDYYDFDFIRQNAPKYGVNFSLKSKKINELVENIFEIAIEGLKEFKLEEEKYIEPAMSLVKENRTPADIIIQNFSGCWKNNIEMLVEYSKID